MEPSDTDIGYDHPVAAGSSRIRQEPHAGAGLCVDVNPFQTFGAGKALEKKHSLRQYFSSPELAAFMASIPDYGQRDIHILDPGAGAGALSVACMKEICKAREPPSKVTVTAYEIDGYLIGKLNNALGKAGDELTGLGIGFIPNIVNRDFVSDYADGSITSDHGITHVVTNPPYEKIGTLSQAYRRLRRSGMQTTNLYAAFVAISCRLLVDGGQIAFITPRSFCSGAYFHRFRTNILNLVSIRRMHIFTSRTSAFKTEDVLQENVIVHAEKGRRYGDIMITSSKGPGNPVTSRMSRRQEVIRPDDTEKIIHIVTSDDGASVSESIARMGCSLGDIGLAVSTGRTIGFKVTDDLRPDGSGSAVPLVMPFNMSNGAIKFPIHGGKSHNFIMPALTSRDSLISNGAYVLVRRIVPPEGKRRVLAAVWDRSLYDTDLVGFENRLNYFHAQGAPLEPNIAGGLCAFLNSTAVDSYVRQFSGTTQVSAADLRHVRYPSLEQLACLMDTVGVSHDQETIDSALGDIMRDWTASKHGTATKKQIGLGRFL